MGIYERYKKDPNGLRRLVELLETTPMKRRQELIDKGMAEDPDYTKAAVEFIITFQDILKLPDMELTELIAAMKPKNVAFCIHKEKDEDKQRFLACVQKTRVLEVHSYLDMTPGPVEIGGARKEAIEMARKLEASGLLSIKKIPKNFNAKEHARSARRSTKADNVPDISADDLFGSGGGEGGKELFGGDLFGDAGGEGGATDDANIIGAKKKAG